MEKIKVAVVDDHKLVSKALENMISSNDDFEVVLNADNGENFLNELQNPEKLPEVVLMDINMPVKNGIETTKILTEEFPDIKVIALTMEDDEKTIIKMLRAGAKGYLLKDMSPEILFSAIDIVSKDGTFYTDVVTESLLGIRSEREELEDILINLKPPELEFMKLSCSELTYKEIAEQMCISPRTIDGYRDSICKKLRVKTRVGIVMFMLKNDLI